MSNSTLRPHRRSMFRIGLLPVMVASLGLSLLLPLRSLSAMDHRAADKRPHPATPTASSHRSALVRRSHTPQVGRIAVLPTTTTTTTTASPTTTPTVPVSAPTQAPANPGPASPPAETLDSYVAGILADIPSGWTVTGWNYTIVAATPNGAMGDTWGPVGSAAPYSEFSRSLMTPLMASEGGREALEMVILHEAMNAKAYSVVDADNWSTVAGWPATFAAEVIPEPGYDDIDAAANCLELGALGFSLNPDSGYAEEDVAGGCSASLAAWLTSEVADPG
jgi:hypothetical protein